MAARLDACADPMAVAAGRDRRARRVAAQGAVVLQDMQMIERASDQCLEKTALQIHILGRIDTGLFRLAQWFRTQSAETR